MPINFVTGDWFSAGVVFDITKILLTEGLGFNVIVTERPGSLEMLHLLAGCATPGECLAGSTSVHHVAMEIFPPALAYRSWIAVADHLGELAPRYLGNLGYDSVEGIYVFEEPRKKYLSCC